VAGDDAADVGEADAGALEFGVGVKTLEDAEEFGGVFHVEADAVVADVEDMFGGIYTLGDGADFDERMEGAGGVFDGVFDEVGPDLAEHGGVGADGGQRFDFPVDGFFAVEADVAHDAGDEFVVIDGGDLHLGAAHAGEFEEIVDETAHATSGVGDDGEVAGGLFVEGSAGVFGEEGGEAVDVAERGAEVVGDGVGEGFELLVGDFEAGVLELEVAVELADAGVRAFALGDVADDGEHFGTLVGFERTEHDIDGEFGVVLAASVEFEACAHGAGAGGGEVGGEVAAVAGVEALGEELFEALSGELVAFPAEELFGAAVGAGDMAAGVDLDHGVGSVVEEPLEHAFALAEGFLGAKALADIAADEQAGSEEEEDGEAAAAEGDGGGGDGGAGGVGGVFGEAAPLLLLHAENDTAQAFDGALAGEEVGAAGDDVERAAAVFGDAGVHDFDRREEGGFEFVELALLARVVGGFAAEGGERRAEGGFGFIEAGDEGFGTGKNEAAGSGLHGEDLDGEVFEAAEGLVGLLDAFEGVVKALRVPSGGEGNQ